MLFLVRSRTPENHHTFFIEAPNHNEAISMYNEGLGIDEFKSHDTSAIHVEVAKTVANITDNIGKAKL